MNIKSLLLGSAAALVAVSGARAADAVVVAEPEPMEYVRICDTYGTGFYYMPGTEVCLKVSGYVRYDIGVGILGHQDVLDKSDALDDGIFETNDTYYKRARAQLRLDARTETELGTLRSYAAINFQYTTNTDGADGVVVGGVDLSGLVTDADDDFGIEHAYIELGGFRVGKTDSLFSTFTGYAGGVINDDLVSYGPFGTHQLAYTFTGGNGFTAAIALEEGDGGSATGDFDGDGDLETVSNLYTIDSYIPHIAGGVGWTQAWGGISVVAGYDSVWEEGAIKGRIDVNASDALSLFLMAGWATNDVGPNYYGSWGGDWAVWGGGTFTATEKAKINLQLAYDEFENFAANLNVNYELVPGFVITPEIVYVDNFDDDDDDDDEIGGFLRFQRTF